MDATSVGDEAVIQELGGTPARRVVRASWQDVEMAGARALLMVVLISRDPYEKALEREPDVSWRTDEGDACAGLGACTGDEGALVGGVSTTVTYV